MNNLQNNFWWRLKLEVPIELEESLVWKCENLTIKSYAFEFKEQNKSKLIFWAWLPASEWFDLDRNSFFNSLKPFAETFQIKLPLPIWEKVQDEDWNTSWKRFWSPDPVGENLLILPAWLELPDVFSRKITLKLDPGSAFGTGSHPTTRLCLEALERFDLNDLRMADIGCGSGILSLAALLLGAKEVLSADIDSLAVRATKENALLNNLSGARLRISLGSINQVQNQLQGSKVDLIVCNILAPVIKSLAPDFSNIASSKGHAFLSGLLVDQIQDITSSLAEYGWQFAASYQQENWALIHLFRGPTKHLPIIS